MAEQKMPSKELIQKMQECETPEQLIELAKTEGIELTKEQAEAAIAQMQDVELEESDLNAVAGGNCTRCWCSDIEKDCWMK
jgi:predicted ribosomally synthesized peptide with nif11-like leader